MDFQFTPRQEKFRQEVRQWLAANLPPDLCVDDPTDERVAPDRATFERRVAWQRTMHKAGWVGISWPTEFGGRGVTLKLFGSELGVRIGDFTGELLGPRVLVNQPSQDVPDAPRWFNRVVSARQYTIAGGTSEIQRNIIGERVLGLAKD